LQIIWSLSDSLESVSRRNSSNGLAVFHFIKILLHLIERQRAGLMTGRKQPTKLRRRLAAPILQEPLRIENGLA
jgi:hypothetical protein